MKKFIVIILLCFTSINATLAYSSYDQSDFDKQLEAIKKENHDIMECVKNDGTYYDSYTKTCECYKKDYEVFWGSCVPENELETVTLIASSDKFFITDRKEQWKYTIWDGSCSSYTDGNSDLLTAQINDSSVWIMIGKDTSCVYKSRKDMSSTVLKVKDKYDSAIKPNIEKLPKGSQEKVLDRVIERLYAKKNATTESGTQGIYLILIYFAKMQKLDLFSLETLF